MTGDWTYVPEHFLSIFHIVISCCNENADNHCKSQVALHGSESTNAKYHCYRLIKSSCSVLQQCNKTCATCWSTHERWFYDIIYYSIIRFLVRSSYPRMLLFWCRTQKVRRQRVLQNENTLNCILLINPTAYMLCRENIPLGTGTQFSNVFFFLPMSHLLRKNSVYCEGNSSRIASRNYRKNWKKKN